MDERRSYWAWAASSGLHGALLALILLGLASAPRFADSPEAIAIETVSLSEMNQVMNGEKAAKPAPEPPTPPPSLRAAQEPAQEPVGEPAPTPPPRPEPPAPPKAVVQDAPTPPVRVKVVDAPPERPKEEKPRGDQIAKLIDDRTEPQPKPARVYDPKAIAKLIGQSRTAAANNPAPAPATPQGLPHHDAPRMSLSMASALDAWLTESYLGCWTPPPTMPEGEVYVAEVKVVFNPDGSLSGRPVLINPPPDPSWKAHAESAMRAVKKCDPLRVPPEYAPYFEQWRVETIHFDPRETQG